MKNKQTDKDTRTGKVDLDKIPNGHRAPTEAARFSEKMGNWRRASFHTQLRLH